MSSALTIVPPAPPAVTGLGVAAGLYPGSPGDDTWCVGYWLHTCASKSDNTRRAYRREAHRWLAFLEATRPLAPHGSLLRSATYEDVDRFVGWISDPLGPALPSDIAERWGVSPDKPKGTRQVLRAAVVALHGMYDELAGAMAGEPPAPVLTYNPFKPFRRQYSSSLEDKAVDVDAPGVAKALSDEAWGMLWDVACEAPPALASERARRVAARRRLALAMLRATWERRSAMAGLTWGDLQRSRERIWKVRRRRKGKGSIWEPIPPALMEEIEVFRRSCGFSVEKLDAEDARSIYWIGDHVGADGPISDDTLYRDIKALLVAAAGRAGELERVDLVAEFTRAGAGPHAIRHTMATQFMAAGGEARRAQEILGHSSITVTTRVYDTRTASETAEALQDQWERSGALVVQTPRG